jgi:DNA-binding NarL/FixJ family response regulator
VIHVHARVLVAAAEATTAGLSQLLEGDGFSVVARAAGADSAVERAHAERPDVCVIDIALAGGGVRAVREICASVPGVAVVMLAAKASADEMIDALRAGACGLLTLDGDPDRLPATLRGVLAGEAAIPRRLTARLVEEVRTQGRRRRIALAPGLRPELTSREWEVIELVRRGLSTDEAATRLYVSPVTVRRHISSVVRKLGVRDRDAAMQLIEEA